MLGIMEKKIRTNFPVLDIGLLPAALFEWRVLDRSYSELFIPKKFSIF